jgi:hypothetical protein
MLIVSPHTTPTAIPPPETRLLNALAPHAKRDDNIFLKLSSGATQNRTAWKRLSGAIKPRRSKDFSVGR